MLKHGPDGLKRLALAAALPLVLAAVLSACGGDDDDTTDGDDATATVVVAEPTLAAGWRAVEGDSFALALPERYVGGDPADAGTFDAIRGLGGNCVAAADLIEPQAALFEFVVVDPDACATPSVRTIQVIVSPSDADDPEEFLDAFVPGLPANATVLDQQEVTLAGAPAATVRIRRDLGAFVTVQALYAVRGDDGWPILAAAAEESDFAAAAAEFDAIAQTFRAN